MGPKAGLPTPGAQRFTAHPDKPGLWSGALPPVLLWASGGLGMSSGGHETLCSPPEPTSAVRSGPTPPAHPWLHQTPSEKMGPFQKRGFWLLFMIRLPWPPAASGRTPHHSMAGWVAEPPSIEPAQSRIPICPIHLCWSPQSRQSMRTGV